MPRGGSKKGEHRGNAKPRTGLETPNEVMRAAVRMVRKPKVPGPHGVTNGPRREQIEEDILAAQMVHGRNSAFDMTPKEVMLDNMHTFQQAAYTTKAMARWILESRPDTEERARDLRQLEMEEERLRRIASDEAYKVSPTMHPRLTAVAVSANQDVGENIVALMFEEIDRRNREHPMVIEHIPTKRLA